MRIEAQDIHDSTIYLTYNIAVYYHQKKEYCICEASKSVFLRGLMKTKVWKDCLKYL
jgi:hypothetical protein